NICPLNCLPAKSGLRLSRGNCCVALSNPMSALGQKQTLAILFNHVIRTSEQRRRNCEAQRFRGLEVNHQLVLGWGLHGKVSRLFAFEDAIDVTGRTLVWLDCFSTVADQSAGDGE